MKKNPQTSVIRQFLVLCLGIMAALYTVWCQPYQLMEDVRKEGQEQTTDTKSDCHTPIKTSGDEESPVLPEQPQLATADVVIPAFSLNLQAGFLSLFHKPLLPDSEDEVSVQQEVVLTAQVYFKTLFRRIISPNAP